MRPTFIILILPFIFLFSYSHGVNTITPGQSIRDGETIMSPSEEFVLGFFSPGNSTNRYVGILYNKISVRTAVWVANRNNPVQDSSGVMSFGKDGNLVVLDGNGRSLWSTNSSTVAGNNATGFLLDSGNLILAVTEVSDPDKALWQSFEDPTDTYVPGMRIWLAPRSNENLFVSWKSESDPSQGNFSMGLPPSGLMEIMAWEGSERRWRSGQWNQQIFIGVPRMTAANYLYGYRVSDIGGRTFFTYTVYNSSELFRYQITWNGIVEQLRWNAVRREWAIFWAEPTRPCEHYNTCGPFGSCRAWISPICSCLRGFEPKSKTEWDSKNWTSGCVRRTQLQCDRNASLGREGDVDQFLELDGHKLPDFSVLVVSHGLDDCRDICLKNCSCKAYSYPNGIQCLTWNGDFLDVQQFRQGGEKLYIRLAASEFGSSKRRETLIIVLVVVLGVVISCISAFLYWKYKVKSGTKSRTFQTDGTELIVHNLQEIIKATDNFSDVNKLGEGGFGPVYKGTLSGGLDVAVKRLSGTSRQGLEEFKNEIILIAKLQHRNLVKLLGYSFEEEEKLLIYEYLPNKSLDAYVFANPQEHLDWNRRFGIIEGIARGLLYLHRDSRFRIIHRDLKVSNILLDQEMNPKISDFGIAKIVGGDECQANTNRVMGTYGYMAPEYAMGGLFSVKSDVYSFGVLLLEIISGKKNNYYSEDSNSLVEYAWKLWSEKRALEFIDLSIRDSCPQTIAMRCINLGLLCVQDSASDRPLMSTVVRVLESDNVTLPSPPKPTFPILRNSRVGTELSLDSSEVHSTNLMTDTMVVGR